MTKFHELPDSIEYNSMKEYFWEYLSYYCNNTNSANVNYALSELLELADRQWHTYELLEEDIKEHIEKYLKQVIDFENTEIMDYILCIIPRIGLGNLFSYILQKKVLFTITKFYLILKSRKLNMEIVLIIHIQACNYFLPKLDCAEKTQHP